MQDQILSAIDIKSGVVKEQTKKAAEGYWVDADKVRFRFGKPELLGGWLNTSTSAKNAEVIGMPRALETVRTLDATRAAVVATNVGVYSSDLSEFYDITPVVTVVGVTNQFNTAAGSTKVVVSVSTHNLTSNTMISIVSATATIGGNVVINTSTTPRFFQVSVLGTNSFEIDTGTTAAATSAATGSTAQITLYANAGLVSNEYVGGWGTGVWGGDFGWNTSPGGTYLMRLRQWSIDLWGTNIMAVPSKGPLYIWDTINGITDRMTLVTAAPSVNQIVRVASEARHVILYGTHDSGGTYDPLLIRWCDQENYNDWTPSVINSAGDNRINSRGSEIRSVTKMADKSAILTDADLFTQNYIGGNDVFGFIRAAENCGAISQNCAVEYGGVLYWMSNTNQFYKYDGRVQPLPCTVLRFIFDNINHIHKDKIYAGTNAEFDEIIWLYPSLDSTTGENDRYVLYNTLEQHWTIGTLSRTTWLDRNTFNEPLATGVEGTGIYYHETGYTDDGTPMQAYLQSAYFDMNDGNNILFSNKFSPDFSSTAYNEPYEGVLSITLKARKYPGGPVITKGPYAISGNSQKVSTRLRGREFSVRVESAVGTDLPWRMGEFRMALEPDGKR